MEYILLKRETNNEISLLIDPVTEETKVFSQVAYALEELKSYPNGILIPLVNIIRLLEDIEIEISTLRVVNRLGDVKSPLERELSKLAYGDGLGEYIVIDNNLNLYGSGSYRESIFNLKESRRIVRTLPKGAFIVPVYNIVSLLKRVSKEIRSLIEQSRCEDLISSQRLRVRDRIEEIAY